MYITSILFCLYIRTHHAQQRTRNIHVIIDILEIRQPLNINTRRNKYCH